jgi:hypothetical protein
MAQSKKQQLKGIGRRCARAGRELTSAASRADDHTLLTLLDTYGLLRQDIRETLDRLRRPQRAELQQITLPVTFQQIDELRARLEALHTWLLSW